MLNFFRVLLVVVALIISVVPYSVDAAAKKVIAIMNVSNMSGVRGAEYVTNHFRESITGVLVQSGTFDVVERYQLDSVFQELAFHETGVIDAKTAIALGKKTGAEYTLIANLVELNAGVVDHFAYKALNGRATFNCKLIDNKTGLIKLSEMVKGSKSKHISDNSRTDQSEVKNLLSGAADECAEKFANRISELGGVTASVMQVSSGKVYVNLGSDQGARVGGMYIAYREGKQLIDPGSGDVIGTTEENVAILKVEEVKGNYCVMVIKKGDEKSLMGCKVKKLVKR